MMAVRVVKKHGQVLLGRVISANAELLSLMLVGNHVVEIPRKRMSIVRPGWMPGEGSFQALMLLPMHRFHQLPDGGVKQDWGTIAPKPAILR